MQDVFEDRIIYQTKDVFGNILVTDYFHFRNLTFDSPYDQSSMDLRAPHILVHEYTRAMILVLAFINPTSATFLGLGGGSLLRSLSSILPDCHLHAIELRQKVYDIASAYFGIPSSNTTVTISDANQSLFELEDDSTDIIFSDMYHSTEMNSFQMEKSFIKQSYRVLSEKGWLVVNYHELPDLDSPVFKTLFNSFSEIFMCQTYNKKNTILFASKELLNAPLYSFESSAVALEKKLEVKMKSLFHRLIKLHPLRT